MTSVRLKSGDGLYELVSITGLFDYFSQLASISSEELSQFGGS